MRVGASYVHVRGASYVHVRGASGLNSFCSHLYRLQTPLHKASWYEYYNVCKILVENGASVLTKDYKASHCSVN